MQPPGPRSPATVQAARYSLGFPGFAADLHARFGPTATIRFPGAPDMVLTADRDAIRRLLTGDPLQRRHANDILLPVLGPGSVLLLEPAPHLARRRLLLPPFHGEAVARYADLLRELIDAQLATWPHDGRVSGHDHARRLTLDLILRAVLGLRDPATSAELGRIFDAMSNPAGNIGLFMPAAALKARWNPAWRHFLRLRARLHTILLAHIEATRADPRLDERDDILALLVRARDEDGRGLSTEDLLDEGKTLVTAGHETTAGAAAWGLDALARRPQIAERLREDDDPAYGRAVAQEVLRAYPVLPVVSARFMLEPFPIGEYVVPVGTGILADAWTIHRDPELHPEPGAFRPERFLGGELAPYSYLPFGGGAHRCIGAALATMELEVLLRGAVQRFDLQPVGPPPRPKRRGLSLIPNGGSRVQVRRRAPAGAPSSRVPSAA